MSEKKLKKKSQHSQTKVKSPFDHLNQIRTTKNPNYWDTLTDADKKNFNHWLILLGLSQDVNLIPLCALLWRDGYYDKIPSKQFYTLLCQLVPYNNNKFPWTKSNKKNSAVLKHIANWYRISTREANDYLQIFMANEQGMKELADILEGLGLNDREAEKVLGETIDE